MLQTTQEEKQNKTRNRGLLLIKNLKCPKLKLNVLFGLKHLFIYLFWFGDVIKKTDFHFSSIQNRFFSGFFSVTSKAKNGLFIQLFVGQHHF